MLLATGTIHVNILQEKHTSKPEESALSASVCSALDLVLKSISSKDQSVPGQSGIHFNEFLANG